MLCGKNTNVYIFIPTPYEGGAGGYGAASDVRQPGQPSVDMLFYGL